MIYYNLQETVNYIMATVSDRNVGLENGMVGSFIGYIFLCALIYIFVWNPYVKRLNLELLRTKSMICIIPFNIIQQVAKIQKFVLDNVLFAN